MKKKDIKLRACRGVAGGIFLAAPFALLSTASAFDVGLYNPVDQAISQVSPEAIDSGERYAWGASNSTDLFSETATVVGTSGGNITPSTAPATAVQAAFDNAVAALNGTDIGSATAYQAARTALTEDPDDTELQSDLALAQQAYNTNITSVTNLEAAAVVTSVSYNTYTGVSGAALGTNLLTDSPGAAADAQSDAALASGAISDVASYFARGAGASTSAANFADLEGEVIDPLRLLVAVDPTLDTDNDGFLDINQSATSDAQSDLTDAQSDYDTVLALSTSTSSDIAVAAGDLAIAQTAFATAVETQYDNFAPITETNKEEILGVVLNGSWERDAINSLSQEQVVQGDGISDNGLAISDNGLAIDTNSENISDNGLAISDNGLAIETNSENISDNGSDIAKEVTDRKALIRVEDGENEDGFIHIGENSFVLDDSAGAHRLTTDDGTLILGGGAVATVDVDADLNVAGDIFASGDIFIGSNLGVQSQLDTNAGAIANNSNRIESNKKDIEQNTRGIAMVAALQHTTVLPGMNNAFDLSAAHFEGETGLALNYARRINENVQINFGAASTTDFDESVIKAGIGVQW